MTKEQIKMKINTIIKDLKALDGDAYKNWQERENKLNLKEPGGYAYRYGWVSQGVEIAIEDLTNLLKNLDRKEVK